MKFSSMKSVGIIGGRGRTGRQFAKIFRSLGFRVRVTGSGDAHRNVALIRACDIVVFALPLSRAATCIAELAPASMRRNQLVLDVSSLKSREVAAMLGFAGEVVGMHPLFGPGTDPAGERIILCPARATQSTVRQLRSLLKRAGLQTTVMPAAEHDALMSAVQVVPHLKSFLVADVLRLLDIDLQRALSLCTPTYEAEFNIVGRFLDDHPDLYMPIIFRNPRILDVLHAMQEAISTYITIAKTGDLQQAEHRYNASRKRFQPFLKRARNRSELCIRTLFSSR